MPVSGGTAVVSAVADATKLGPSLAAGVRSAGGSSAVKGAMSSVGKVMGVTLGAAFLFSFGKKSLEAVQEADKVNALLQRSLGKIGTSGAAAFGPVVEWANKLQFQIGQDDEAIKTMAARLAQMGQAFFRAVGPDAASALEKLTLGLTDMAAATGKSASMLMRSLGPAILNTPEKAIPLLQKLGSLTDEQAAKVTALAAAGDKQAATQEIINDLSRQYAGAAAAAATPSEKLGVAMDEIQEAAGRLLLPIVQLAAGVAKWIVSNIKLVGAITAVVTAVILWQTVLKGSVVLSVLKGVAQLAGGFLSLAAAQGISSAAAALATGVYTTLLVPLGAMLVAIGPVVAALGVLYVAFQLATGQAGSFAEEVAARFIPDAKRVAETLVLMKTSGLSWADAAKVVAGETDNLRFHIDKAGHAARNFANMTGDALNDFRKGVVESVQVAVGQFKNVGEAFTITTRQLQNQARAAVRIAMQEHRDLKAIFSDKSLTEGQKAALASLPPDMRRAWAEGGKAARQQIAEDALKLRHLNAQNFRTLTASSKAQASTGGSATGAALIAGMIHGVVSKSPALQAAVVQAVADAIAAGNRAAGIESPSKEGERTGRFYVEGIIKGLLAESKSLARTAERIIEVLRAALSDDKGALKDAIRKGIGVAAAEAKVALDKMQLDIARGWEKSVNTAKRYLDRLVQHFRDFKNAIRAGFSEMQDLAGAIGGLFGQTDEEGNPVAVTAAMIGQTIADKVAQAQQLASLLQEAAGAGLSKGLVAQFAGQGAAAIPELQALLASPELIAQLNAAGKAIADAAGQTADALGEKFFAKAIQHASNKLDHLSDAIERFVARLQRLLGDASAQLSNQLAAIQAAAATATVPTGTTGGGSGGGGGGWEPTWHPTWEPTWKPGQNNITVEVHGDVLTEGELIRKLDEGLAKARRLNGTLALDRV